MSDDHIAFNATLSKISTSIDGGWKVTLDVSQTDAEEIMKLSEHRDQLLTVAVLPTKKVRK